MRFVHARGDLGLLLGGSVLDRCRDLRCIIHMGEFVLPWAMRVPGSLSVLHQIASALPFGVPWARGVDIAQHPRKRVGTRPGRRDPASLKAGGSPATARRLGLAVYSREPPRQRDVSPRERGPSGPAASRGHETRQGCCEGRGHAPAGPWREAVPQPESPARSAPGACPLPASLEASRPPRPWAAGAYPVPPHSPSPPALARVRQDTAGG